MQGFEITCSFDHNLVSDILGEIYNLPMHEPLTIDFRNAGFATAFSLTYLVLVLNLLSKNRKIKLIFSPTSSLLYYCSRMGFFYELSENIDVIPFEARNKKHIEKYRQTKDTLLEITLVDEEKIPNIVEHIQVTMINVLKYDEIFAGNTALILSELLNNIIDHSDNRENNYVSLQSYKKGCFAEISVVDCGIGISNSLRGNLNININDDSEGILTALKKGISRFENRDRGVGLHTCLELTRKYKGSMYIRSGEGQIFIRGNNTYTGKVIYFPGTQISIKIPFK